jgi:threonyl-tRNA synthetase
MERFLGILIEHYAGALPLWLSPEQVRVLPISEKTNEYAAQVMQRLQTAGLRCTMDAADDKINAKIKRAHEWKTPYMLVLGPKEAQQGAVTVRTRAKPEQRQQSIEDFLAMALEQVQKREAQLR